MLFVNPFGGFLIVFVFHYSTFFRDEAKSLLTDEHSAYCYLALPEIDTKELHQRLLAILADMHGGWEIPKEELEAIADVILPGVIKFFSSEEGRAEFDAWKKEQEL